jgi:hypothetical protein
MVVYLRATVKRKIAAWNNRRATAPGCDARKGRRRAGPPNSKFEYRRNAARAAGEAGLSNPKQIQIFE